MGVFTHLDERDARAVAEAYGLGELRAVTGIPAGSVNSNYALDCARGRFFLRIYEEQDAGGATAEARLLTALAARGVKTPAPMPRDDGRATTIAGKPAAVFPWRSGGMRCQASVSPADARAVGAELARVHVAGDGLEVAEGRFRVEDLRVRLGVIANATDPELAAQAPVLERALERWAAARRADAPRGLIHGDLFRDNVLWEGDQVAALLDFESASRGPFAFDVMVTVLSWSFGDRFDAGIARAIVDGYRSVREMGEGERAALLAEGCLAATRFTITRITDYAMKQGIGARVMKDWRRFAMRLATLEGLGESGLRAALGV